MFANRVWGRLFGRGIVRTADNFGSLGTPPTHPDLLDHLAVRFVRNGWGIKALVRDLVTEPHLPDVVGAPGGGCGGRGE